MSEVWGETGGVILVEIYLYGNMMLGERSLFIFRFIFFNLKIIKIKFRNIELFVKDYIRYKFWSWDFRFF